MLKTYNFWIKLVAVLILIVRIVGDKFGFYVDSVLYMDIATALASVLVILGVIQVPPTTSASGAENQIKEGNSVREDIALTLKEMAEKLKGITGNSGCKELEPITDLMDEILIEAGEEVEKTQKSSEKIENVEENSVQGEESLKMEEEKMLENSQDGDVIIEEDLSAEESRMIENYLVENLNQEAKEGEAEAVEAGDIEEETLGDSEGSDEVYQALKEKIKTLIEDNLDDIISSLVG